MSISKLTYNGKEYSDEIVSEGGRVEMAHSMAGESLFADSLVVPVTTGKQPVRFLATDQDENDFFVTLDDEIFAIGDGIEPPEYIKNEPGLFYFDSELFVKQYLHQIKRRSKNEYEMTFYSAVWLLEQSDHAGGLYTGETVESVLGEILGNIVVYSIDDDIKNIQIYGYLPYDKRRNNLMKVLMATSAALKNASDGSLRITQLSGVSAGTINEERVYLGGSVSDTPPVTAVQVTEHNYLSSMEEVTLFDDSSLGTETVIFNEPYHNLTIDGGTIIASGVNFCTFSADGYVTLTGQRYNHVTRIVTVGDAPAGTDSDTVRSVTDNTLLTPNNAVPVAEKLYDYLTKSQTIRQDIIVGTERPGDVVSVINPYTKEMVDACIKSMSVQFGKSKLKAACEFLVDCVPSGATAGFEHYDLLTDSGTWTVPEGVTRIRIIAVDPGSPGGTGGAGQNGSTSSGGNGGTPGAGGNGGRILEINLSVTPLSSKEYNCGEHTVFDGISAETGRTYPYGYTEPKTGLVLGKKGQTGELPGGAGSGSSAPGPTVTKGEAVYYPGPSGSSSTNYGTTAYGGWGGGAGSAGDGQHGQNGTVAQTGGYSQADWIKTGRGSPSSDLPNGANYYSDWQASYSFNSSAGTFSTYGGYGFIIPTRQTVYKSFGTYCLVASIAPPSYWYTYRIDRTGSPVSGKTQGGGGGDGGPGAPGADATGYGEGGHGGDGGGGGGASRGYEYARIGQGGPGGPGGDGGPGCIIVYY